jgi:leucyl aminopeptidase
MQVNLLKKPVSSQNIILLTDQIQFVYQNLDKETATYFEKEWEKEAFQFLKTPKGYIILIKIEKNNQDAVRKAAHKAHGYLNQLESATLISDHNAMTLRFIEGLLLSNYQFIKYLTAAEKKKFKLQILEIVAPVSKSEIVEIQNVIQSVYWVRNLVNEPASHLSAEKLAHEIEKLFEKTEVKVEVLHQSKIEALKMGGLLAVNKGSIAPATFSIVEYKPKSAKNEKPIVLVGKGVVYDTGGLNIKTANYMDGMKSDMAGAATMIGTIDTLQKNKIPIHVIGLIPSTDNRPGGEAFASGDIIKMYDGTTVEVLNTDAEGRMILADALAYANKYKPELVIDAATLTGAAVRALGNKVSISMGNAKDKYFKQLYDAGIETYDRVFRFPFWEEWAEEMKSDIADLKNLGGANAGMITAGKFLEHFVKYPYIHMDIAGPAYLDVADSYNGKGGTGAGVRLLYQFLKNLK